jgi:predicted transcriptional regulator of viral defense system
VQTLKPDGYFTHQSALFFHGLTQSPPTNIYLNFEQQMASTPGSTLDQTVVDRVFKNKPRTTNYLTDCDGHNVYVLNGRQTGRLGVVRQPVEQVTQSTTAIQFTTLARTLIDCTVRPAYAGRAITVAEAFKRAKGQVDPREIARMLLKLAYAYPYHQCIGFYLEHAGYAPAECEVFRKMPTKIDFYLENQIVRPTHNKKWRLHVPRSLVSGPS